MSVRRLIVVAAAVAACAGCGGSAAVTAEQLALMPLPKSAYGPEAASLTIDSSSGVVDNADAARSDLDPRVTPGSLARLGRETGYSLDYSSVRAFVAHAGLVDAASGVDLFEDADGAAQYVAKELAQPAALARRGASGITFAHVSSFRLALPFGAATGVQGELRLGGASFWTTFVLFRRDALVAEVSLTRADGFENDRAETVRLARLLDRRVRDVLDRRIRGEPVPLPAATRQALGGLGRSKGGPELADAAVGAAELAAGTVVGEGYARDPATVANFVRRLEPALLGASALARADVNVQQHRTAKDGLAAYATRRAAVTGSRGRDFLAETFASVLATGKAEFGQPQTVEAGNAAFFLRTSVTPPRGKPTQLVVSIVNVGPLDQTVTLIGEPGARLADGEVEAVLHKAAARMRDSLRARRGTIPA